MATACLALAFPGHALAQAPTATFGVPSAAETTPTASNGLFPPSLVSPTSPASQDSERRRIPLFAFWDNGLRFESKDDQFHLHLGGTIQLDSTWPIGPASVFALPNGGANGVGNSSATFLRRARLRTDGDLFGLFDFIIEYDFANASNENSGDDPASFGNLTSSPSPANVWMQIRDVPLFGHVRIGNQKKPIGMLNNTSHANLPFLERPDSSDAIYAPFDGGFALGVSAQNWIESERMAWRIGIYRPATNVFTVALNKYAFGARLTGLPWHADNGQSLVHLGLGLWGGEIVQDALRLRARPLIRNGPGFAVPVILDTGQFPGSRQLTLAPEFALVRGPLTIQAEWAGQLVTDTVSNGQAQGTTFFHGGHVEALWFLTGEQMQYEKRDGVFGRVVPRNDYNLRGRDSFSSLGAWQVGARFSYLDLNDKAIQGGRVHDWTFGLNWFLTANMKFQFNYILEHRDGPTGMPVGWFSGFGVRANTTF
jgi:phosphate-selective porin OprO/OprP